MTVSELLEASRAAHLRYRENLPRMVPGSPRAVKVAGDAAAANLALVDAYNFRTAADDADPAHIDAAWADEQVSHDELMTFYRAQLGVPVPVR